MKRFAVAGSLAVLIALVACGGGTPKTNPSISVVTRPTSTGHVTILSPTLRQVIHGTVLHVRLQLTGARLVPTASANITPDTGHIHVSIDGKIKWEDGKLNTCKLCGGAGKVRCEDCQSAQTPCAACAGKGKLDGRCLECAGTGVLVCVLCTSETACAQCSGARALA
jgi:hypothetical protein